MSTFESLSFYRGVSAKYPTNLPYVKEPRRNRRPRNTPHNFHEIANNWFRNRFGIAYRSEGLFVMSNLISAAAYAGSPDHVARIVPLSAYRYCWSPKISDLLFVAKRMALSSVNDIENYLDSVGYQEYGLKEAHDAGHEVMLYCDRYVAIPVALLGRKILPDSPGIILST